MLIAACLMSCFQPLVDEEGICSGWNELRDAWAALDKVKAQRDDTLDDACLSSVSKVHGALEVAKLNRPASTYIAGVMKQMLKLRVTSALFRSTSTDVRLTPNEASDLEPLVVKLRARRAGNAAHADDELLKCLATMGIAAQETPRWLQIRAIVLLSALAQGHDYPQLSKPDSRQLERAQEWVSNLTADDIALREEATTSLSANGETAVALLEAVALGADAEGRARAGRILGLRHSPWNQKTLDCQRGFHVDIDW